MQEYPEHFDSKEIPVPTSKEERMWAMLCHLSTLLGFTGVVPLAGVIPPLVIWMMKKDVYFLVNDQGKEAINFQICIAIYSAISWALVFVGIGLLLLPAVALFCLVFTIIAGIKANEGHYYRYPLTIRFV